MPRRRLLLVLLLFLPGRLPCCRLIRGRLPRRRLALLLVLLIRRADELLLQALGISQLLLQALDRLPQIDDQFVLLRNTQHTSHHTAPTISSTKDATAPHKRTRTSAQALHAAGMIRANLRPGLFSASWARAGRFALRFSQVCDLWAAGFLHLGHGRDGGGRGGQGISSMRAPDSCISPTCAHISCDAMACCAVCATICGAIACAKKTACPPHIIVAAYPICGTRVCGAYIGTPHVGGAHICGAHAACGAYVACGA